MIHSSILKKTRHITKKHGGFPSLKEIAIKGIKLDKTGRELFDFWFTDKLRFIEDELYFVCSFR